MTREWYFQVMGQELGPLSGGELKAKVTSGQVQPDTLVRKGLEGKWLYAAKVKGLFPSPEEQPVEEPPAPPPSAKSKSSATMPIVDSSTKRDKPGSSAEIKAQQQVPAAHAPARTMLLAEDDDEENKPSRPPSVEFYDFVGFREAISPVLYDAVKKFVTDRGITMSQVNRRALAEFIERPELASDLMITAVAAIPQPVKSKSNQNGNHPLSERERHEQATFRFTLFNSGTSSMHVIEAVFLPETVEERTYDSTGDEAPLPLDHAGHVPVSFSGLVGGKAVRMQLDVTIPPQETHDLFVWFHAENKPSLTKVRGQLLVGHGGELAMSQYFTVILHGDSPRPGG
jgi:GYF domain 2